MSTGSFTPDLQAVANRYRTALKARDAQILSDLAREYGYVFQVARKELYALQAKIVTAQEAGEAITPGWLYREGRLGQIMQQIGLQMEQFVGDAASRLEQASQDALYDAFDYAYKSAEASTGAAPGATNLGTLWAQVSQSAVQAILANTAPNGPVQNLLHEIAPMGANEARDALVNGVAQGYAPQKVARELRSALDTTLTRAQVIARTEMMRAQRDATLAGYRENSDMVQGWIWSAADDDRTCEDCWALDGSYFDIGTEADAHVNCRCTMVPETKPLADLGFTGPVDIGEELDPDGIAQSLIERGANVDLVKGEVTVYQILGRTDLPGLERYGQIPDMPRFWRRDDAMAAPKAFHDDTVIPIKVPLRYIDNASTTPEILFYGDFDQVRSWVQTGAARFARLSPARQLKILGPAKFKAYQREAVQLRDFIGYKTSPIWGRTGYARSLKEILGPDEAKLYYRQPKPKPPKAPKARKGAVKESPVEKTLQSAPLTSSEAMDGGSQGAQHVRLRDDGDGVLKPVSKADPALARHPSIPPYHDPERDRAGYLVAREMGVDTPVTVVRDEAWHDLGMSSLQEFRDFSKYWEGAVTDAELRRMRLLDIVIGNLDRHGGNLGVTPEGTLIVFDHGFTFPKYIFSHSYDWPGNDALMGKFLGETLTTEERAILTSLKSTRFKNLLATSGLDQQSIDQMYHRIDAMLSENRILEISKADQWGRTPQEIIDSGKEAVRTWEGEIGSSSGASARYDFSTPEPTPEGEWTHVHRLFDEEGYGIGDIANSMGWSKLDVINALDMYPPINRYRQLGWNVRSIAEEMGIGESDVRLVLSDLSEMPLSQWTVSMKSSIRKDWFENHHDAAKIAQNYDLPKSQVILYLRSIDRGFLPGSAQMRLSQAEIHTIRSKFSPTQVEHIMQLWQDLLSPEDIALRLNLSAGDVRNYLKATGYI
jgi:SPP1 gp7 family putative phage head morphogenesis protein